MDKESHLIDAWCLCDSRVSATYQLTAYGTGFHTIFEGTSEIQQLVIARAISGLRVE